MGTSCMELRTRSGGLSGGRHRHYWRLLLDEASSKPIGKGHGQCRAEQSRARVRQTSEDKWTPAATDGWPYKKNPWVYNRFITWLSLKTNCRNNLCTKFAITMLVEKPVEKQPLTINVEGHALATPIPQRPCLGPCPFAAVWRCWISQFLVQIHSFVLRGQ